MSIKLRTPSNGSVTLSPQDTASNLSLTVPALAGSLVTADSTGNVGIGVSTSSSRLTLQDLTGTADKAICDFVAQNSSGVSYFNYDFYGTSGSSGFLRFRKARGSQSAPTIIGDDAIARIGGMSYDGAKFLDAAMIRFASDGAPALNSSPGRIEFWTTPNGSAGGLVRNLTIDRDGNQFIGTTTNPLLNAVGRLNIVASGGDGINLKHTTNGNNIINIWQTGTISCAALSFAKGDTQNGVGSIGISTTGTSYNTTSDYRLKENVQPMTGALAKVAQLKPVTYKWKVDGSDGQGFIAHELQAVVPDAVTGEKDAVDKDGNPAYQGVDTSFLVATLTAAIKEQQAMITQLQSRIEALENA